MDRGVTISLAEALVLDRFRRLVFEQYGERNWLDRNGTIEDQVLDKHDPCSEVITVNQGDEVIAGMRLVRDEGEGFPHEELLGLSKLDPHGYYETEALRKLSVTKRQDMREITKLVGKRRERSLTIDLAKCLYWYAKTRNVSLFVMVIDNDFLKLCSLLGIPIHPIDESVFCEGSLTTPAVIDPGEFPMRLRARSEKTWNYVSSPDNLHHTLLPQ